MGMIGQFQTVSADQLDNILKAPHAIADFLYKPGADKSERIDVDKAWHGIHFLLAGTTWEANNTAGEAVMGGRVVAEIDLGMGPCRYHTVERVREISSELEKLAPDTLKPRFDPAAMMQNAIYPMMWDQNDPDDLKYLISNYRKLQKFYMEAGQKGSAMLLWIS